MKKDKKTIHEKIEQLCDSQNLSDKVRKKIIKLCKESYIEGSNSSYNIFVRGKTNYPEITGYKLLASSYKALDVVAELLKKDDKLLNSIDGHTDNTGKDDANNS